MNVQPICDRWRDEADLFESRGMEREAQMVRSYADELEAAQREYLYETLTLEQAADEAGRSYDTVQRWVADGTVPNAGEKGRPRVRRCDLLPNVETVADSDGARFAEKVLRARS